jgi:hypothetical protein
MSNLFLLTGRALLSVIPENHNVSLGKEFELATLRTAVISEQAVLAQMGALISDIPETIVRHFHYRFPSLCGLSRLKTLYGFLKTCHFLKSSKSLHVSA